jgi:hypothetical protein
MPPTSGYRRRIFPAPVGEILERELLEAGDDLFILLVYAKRFERRHVG